jgi:hypothetical protein
MSASPEQRKALARSLGAVVLDDPRQPGPIPPRVPQCAEKAIVCRPSAQALARRLYEGGLIVNSVGCVGVRALSSVDVCERRSSLYRLLGGRTRRHWRPASGAQFQKGRQAARRTPRPARRALRAGRHQGVCDLDLIQRATYARASSSSLFGDKRSLPPGRPSFIAFQRKRARWPGPDTCSSAKAASPIPISSLAEGQEAGDALACAKVTPASDQPVGARFD